MRGLATTCLGLAFVAILMASCEKTSSTATDGGTVTDGGTTDGGTTTDGGLTPCLDQPSSLARPPDGKLPCELLPPGFAPAR